MGLPRPFRRDDKVTVHGLMLTEGKPVPGRIVCNNRKSKYGETLVVLYDFADSEHLVTFKPDGRRYLAENNCRITLGHIGDKS